MGALNQEDLVAADAFQESRLDLTVAKVLNIYFSLLATVAFTDLGSKVLGACSRENFCRWSHEFWKYAAKILTSALITGEKRLESLVFPMFICAGVRNFMQVSYSGTLGKLSERHCCRALRCGRICFFYHCFLAVQVVINSAANKECQKQGNAINEKKEKNWMESPHA